MQAGNSSLIFKMKQSCLFVSLRLTQDRKDNFVPANQLLELLK